MRFEAQQARAVPVLEDQAGDPERCGGREQVCQDPDGGDQRGLQRDQQEQEAQVSTAGAAK